MIDRVQPLVVIPQKRSRWQPASTSDAPQPVAVQRKPQSNLWGRRGPYGSEGGVNGSNTNTNLNEVRPIRLLPG